MTKIIAVVNRKGGVGKTATAAHLGAGLARRDHSVLLVDGDSQKNLTTHMGVQERLDDPTAITINEAYRSPTKYAVAAVGPSVTPGVDLMYGSGALEDTEKELLTGQHPSAGTLLRKILRLVLEQKQYDYVLIDCPPAEGLLTRNAIVAADRILTPIFTDYAGFEGLGRLKDLILKLESQEAFEKSVPPIAAFAYYVDERVVRSRELRDYLMSPDFTAENEGDVSVSALTTQIHRNDAIPDCYGEKKAIFDFFRTDGKGRKRTSDPGVKRSREEFAALAAEVDRG